MSATPHELRARLAALMPRDQHRLARRIDGARQAWDPHAQQARLDEIAAEIGRAERRVERRRAGVPEVRYPPALPISQRKDDILAAIRDHQVVIVAGETGSGKSTQLPKICLELGRGVRGLIGHTQPRRLAARTVAERIAEELGTPLGGAVGYAVRFTDQVGEDTLVKLMTDGILLAEVRHDRLLRQYDTLIIDEAHERSLNIDFILGYLTRLLPRREDLKVIITSATIDTQRLSHHFDDAPVIEVSGRAYPVEIRYRPLGEDLDQTQAIHDATDELRASGPGDILVFLSGEREIRDTADALKEPGVEILPLYARLSAAEQHRVFQPHTGRRVVLATNVAETSLTVPGVRYVIDPGTARVSRYSHRTKVQRLPIEAVSQASANQRAGRCGRTSDGVCIRLYGEEDFLSLPEFTDPEILRTNLASVILQMAALELGDIAAFPFIDAPDRRAVADGVALLQELGAFDQGKRLTPMGRRLARLPVDPRLARMILEADRQTCLREVLVIVAALSIQDPRERPADSQAAAAERHGRFADPASDFMAYLNLWQYLRERQEALSSGRFRKLCRAEFLHHLRVREWQDLHGQLRRVAADLGLSLNDEPADPQRIHLSLLAGLLSHIGLRDDQKREYQGARGARFAVFPGSALFKSSPQGEGGRGATAGGWGPQWVMAAELVETSRLWGRTVARIEPQWAERLAPHLVKRRCSEPHWDRERGAVMAYETVTLYGLPLVAQRRVQYGRIDPALSRELFIRRALVEGDWTTHHQFFHDNRKLVAEIEDLEHRARRRDLLTDDETLFDFYDQRVGQDVVSARHFDSWWKKIRAARPDLLAFDRSMLIDERAGAVSALDYPDVWRQGGLRLRLTYEFEPGSPSDGVTVHIPLALLGQVTADGFDWQVPGLREELVTALIRSLPKPVRRSFVPVPDFVNAALARMTPCEQPLLRSLERELGRLGRVTVPRDAWGLDRVPDHLKITFRVTDEHSRTLAEGKDLAALKLQLRGAMRAALSTGAGGVEQHGQRTWAFGTLPRTVEQQRAGHAVTAYPALVDEGDSVAVHVLGTEAEQRRAMWQGTRRLLLLSMPSPVKLIRGRLTNEVKLALGRHPHHSVTDLLDDAVACAADRLLAEHGGPAWDQDGFAALRDVVRAELADAALDAVTHAGRILAAWHRVEQRLAAVANPAHEPALADVRAQLSGLVYPGFVTATGWRRLPDVLRYLRAVERRLDRLASSPARDRELMETVQAVAQACQRRLDEAPPGGPVADALLGIRWMIEELRVSSFAQTLGTPYPVSAKRILRALDQLAP
ncbi:MAG: ATP-dependent RNA helicase HrpA [Egibacteraceae bacterium]